jgi:hypothetical protein
MSSRDALRAFKPKVHKHEYEGQTFHVRSLSGAGRAKYLELCNEKDGPRMSKVVALGLCDESGNLEFNVEQEKDVAEIESVDGAVLQSIVFKLYEVSGLTKKALDEAEKNS